MEIALDEPSTVVDFEMIGDKVAFSFDQHEVCVLVCFIDPRVRQIRNKASSRPGIFSSRPGISSRTLHF